MIQSEELPLAELLDEKCFEDVLKKHEIEFGTSESVVYTAAITLWALVSQALFSSEHRSCKAAVLRVAAYWDSVGRDVCKTDTGAYCRARSKYSSESIHDMVKEFAAGVEQSTVVQAAISSQQPKEKSLCPELIAQVQAIAPSGRLIMVDGFTVVAADTPENQAEYPQNPAQKAGLGQPIMRAVVLTSMSTGLVIDAETGPYSGKESGETALLRKLLGGLSHGDVLVADSYYCTYWLVAECRRLGIHIVMKNHHQRDNNPPRSRRINQNERIVTWERPARPEWMSPEEYAKQPLNVEIRLVDVQVETAGFRTKSFTVATTMLDHVTWPGRWIASVYQGRWLVELDIRTAKCSLGMDFLRAKTPDMVRTEFWSCLLAMNLVRMKMLQAAIQSGRAPRSLSFTATMQLLGVNWLLSAVNGVSPQMAQMAQEASCSERVGNRPNRYEPRANKRRKKVIAFMTKPRAAYHRENAIAA